MAFNDFMEPLNGICSSSLKELTHFLERCLCVIMCGNRELLSSSCHFFYSLQKGRRESMTHYINNVPEDKLLDVEEQEESDAEAKSEQGEDESSSDDDFDSAEDSIYKPPPNCDEYDDDIDAVEA